MRENHNRRKGYQQEQRAAVYLKQKGYEIIKCNFYSHYGEIDIIARDKTYLVFIEVKYRRNAKGGHPAEAVNAVKQRRICRTADWFCKRYSIQEETPCRFDVIGIEGEEIVHIENAFSYIAGNNY